MKSYFNETFTCEFKEETIKVNFDWQGPDFSVGINEGELTLCEIFNTNNIDILDTLSKEEIQSLEERASEYLNDKAENF
jgi:hypothetical protein